MGGGIFSSFSSPSSSTVLTNSTIGNNEAKYGGGIYTISPSLVLTNSKISHNKANDGGVIYFASDFYSSSLTLLNTTFVGNKGPNSIHYNYGSTNTLKVHNSIIFGNQATDGTPLRGSDWLGGRNQNNIPTEDKLEYKHSLVQGHATSENGNIADTGQAVTDLFVDPAQGDYRLKSTSPLINQGNDALYEGGNLNLNTDQDLAGNPRLFGENIDIGAYENQCNLIATVLSHSVLCFGEATGSAKVEVVGGIAPYTYAWSHDIALTTNVGIHLTAGTYTVTVTDANGCETAQTFAIIQPDALEATPTQTHVTCYGEANGSAQVEVTGGTAPYTYTWDNGITSTTNEATGLVKGTYTVSITDAHGCTITRDFEIAEPSEVAMPQVSTPVVYTYGDTALPLTATAGAVNTLLWYATETGGQGMTTAPTPSTTAIGTQTYWVSQRTPTGCESERQHIEVQVKKATLNVVAESNQTKVYGSADGVFTYRVTGFKAGDDQSLLTGALARQAGESVGRYAINLGTLDVGINYDIHFVSANYEITAASGPWR